MKKKTGKIKDLFKSEKTGALRQHFPKIFKAMEGGKDLLKQITRSRGFGMGMYPPPRPQRGSDQTAASLNGVLRRSESEEILQGSENG